MWNKRGQVIVYTVFAILLYTLFILQWLFDIYMKVKNNTLSLYEHLQGDLLFLVSPIMALLQKDMRGDSFPKN